MPYKTLLILIVFLKSSFLFNTSVHAATIEDATNMIEDFHALLLDNMKNSEALGFRGRYNAIAPLIEQHFDFPLIAKVILSRYWKKVTEIQKNLFIDQLSELTKATYAARFEGFNNEAFMTVGTETLRKGRILVKTQIIANNDEDVSLNYLLQPVDNNWRIISVIANGVNDLSLKRAEYSSIIKDKGFDELIEQISLKIKEYEDF